MAGRQPALAKLLFVGLLYAYDYCTQNRSASATGFATGLLVVVDQAGHGMLPTAGCEERGREDFVKQLSVFLEVEARPTLRRLYEREVADELTTRLGREPNHREIANRMRSEPLNQAWYALRTYNQQRMFRLGAEIVARQRETLSRRAKGFPGGGTLTLDPDVTIPSYLQNDIHLQPGGYHRELAPEDLSAGAVYDRVISIHSMGSQGPNNDDAGHSIAAWLTTHYTRLAPRRILDLGCTVGHFTLPFKQAFPDAEVFGVDVAAPCLRYAHARAKAQGVTAHFRQANAEKLPFDDGSFDLIVSRQFLHETSLCALERIFDECHRLLRVNGLMLHQDAPQFDELDSYTASLRDWDIRCNNEPFMATCYSLNLEALYQESGFLQEQTFRAYAPSLFCQANDVSPFATRSAAGRYFFTGAVRSR